MLENRIFLAVSIVAFFTPRFPISANGKFWFYRFFIFYLSTFEARQKLVRVSAYFRRYSYPQRSVIIMSPMHTQKNTGFPLKIRLGVGFADSLARLGGACCLCCGLDATPLFFPAGERAQHVARWRRDTHRCAHRNMLAYG